MSGPILISTVTTVKSRLSQIQELLPRLLHQRIDYSYEIVLVDYACPDKTADWAQEKIRLPPGSCEGVSVISVKDVEDKPFNVSHARNLGSKAARGHVLCFLDADALPEYGWLEAAASPILNDRCDVTHPRWKHRGKGYVALWAKEFHRLRGYDESMVGWGYEDEDFYNRAVYVNRLWEYSDSYIDVTAHDDELRTRHYEDKKPQRSKRMNHRRASDRKGSVNPGGYGFGQGTLYRLNRVIPAPAMEGPQPSMSDRDKEGSAVVPTVVSPSETGSCPEMG